MNHDDRVRVWLERRGCPPYAVDGGIDGLIDRWEGVADEVEDVYEEALDDWLNDLDGRQMLAELHAEIPEAFTPQRLKRLAAIDRRVRHDTTTATECLWGEAQADEAGWSPDREWWYWAVPRNPGEDLSADLGL